MRSRSVISSGGGACKKKHEQRRQATAGKSDFNLLVLVLVSKNAKVVLPPLFFLAFLVSCAHLLRMCSVLESNGEMISLKRCAPWSLGKTCVNFLGGLRGGLIKSERRFAWHSASCQIRTQICGLKTTATQSS